VDNILGLIYRFLYRIGLSIAKRLGEEGSTVFVSSRKETNVKEAVKQLKDLGIDVYGTTCHVGNPEDRKKLFDLVRKEKGGLDFLVSNAAVNPFFGRLLDVSMIPSLQSILTLLFRPQRMHGTRYLRSMSSVLSC